MESVITLDFAATQVPEEVISSVYRYAVSHGTISAVPQVADDLVLGVGDVQAAVEHLLEYRLLRGATVDGPLVPVDPEIAAAALVSPMESEIYERRERIARIQSRIDGLRQAYERACPPAHRSASVEHVTGSLEVAGFLKLAADECTREVMVLRSGRPDAAQLEEFLRVCQSLTQRGIAVRVICEHRSRADFTARMKIKNLMDEGAELRTVSHVPRAAVVFDQSVAVLLASADGQTAASRVRSGDVVQFLADMFSHLWDAATPVDSFESGYAEVADDLKLAIVSLMAKGYTDEVLARKLGMSVRTCRRHIAAMMRDLDAVSRFQAGVVASQRLLDQV
jgi:DNA-binding NarL/FixJ family response regulator